MSIADKLNSLITARNNIRTALTGKGVSAAASHGFEDFADDVDSIFIFNPDDHVFKISLENGEYVRSYDYIGKTVTTLPSNKYKNDTSIIEVNLPLTITTIGSYAFSGDTSLEYINLDNVTTLQDYAFQKCVNVKKFDFPNLVTITNLSFNGYRDGNTVFMTEEISAPKLENIPASTFSYNNGIDGGFKNLKTIDFSGVQTIGQSAFARTALDCPISFPNLTSIAKQAFQYSTIKKVVNLGSVTTIPGDTFSDCSQLTFVRYPATVTSIGAMWRTNSITTIICLAVTPPSVSWNKVPTEIFVPDESVTSYQGTTGWSTYASRIKPLSEYTGTD